MKTKDKVEYWLKKHPYLRDNDNRKIIVPDAPLKNLLGVEEDQEVTYFNIQKFMNKHFVKDEELLNT